MKQEVNIQKLYGENGMGNELVSVLMVNYNHEDTIGETIESVLRQDYQNMQFIIVDDGSTDSSCKVIKSYKDERIELYKLEKNRHICYATNYGFQKVKGEFLARIDSDDIWYPDKLERQMDFLRSNPDRDICFSWIDLIDETGRNINEEYREMVELFETSFRGQSDCLHTFYFLGNCLSHPSVLMRTGIMRETGDFDLGYMQSHDFDYWVRIAKKHPLYVMPERLLAMRRFMGEGKENINNSNQSDISNTRFFNEYMDIRAHFFDGMDDGLFCDTFRNDFVCPDSETDLELECEKAFLLCRPILSEQAVPAAGIRRFHELLRNQDAVRLLEEKYQFTVKDFYQMTGGHLFCDRMWNERMHRKSEECSRIQAENDRLRAEIKRQRKEIKDYAESTSWKVTAPLRAAGKILRK